MRCPTRPWPGLAVVAVAFAAGSVPVSNIAAVWLTGTDLRATGTGTASGSGLYELTGFGPLAAVGLVEVGKGALGPLLARHLRTGGQPALMTSAGTAAVLGHNFSPFLRGAGGRGLAPALGATLVLAPEATGVLLAGLAGGRCVHRTGLGCFLAYLALAPVMYRTRGHAGLAQAAAITGPLLLKRVLGNQRPAVRRPGVYVRRLVLDHD